jgi:hypothetical protein
VLSDPRGREVGEGGKAEEILYKQLNSIPRTADPEKKFK